MKVCVVGGGRMGLPLATALANAGAEVMVADIDAAVVGAINAGECPYEEPSLAPLMADAHARGRLHGATDTSVAVKSADVIIVIVPAHLTPEREIDLSILEAVSADIGRGLSPGALVIYETTVAVGGTRRKLMPILEQVSGMRAGSDFDVAYSPERVKANLVFERLHKTPKVVGGLDAASERRAAAFYRQHLHCPVQEVGSLEAAEMTKLLGMLYRDVNIALANELSAFCEMAGVDFDRIREAANSDGEANLLLPGIGVGGHCTPVYPYFLNRESRRLGVPQRLSEAAREINDLQPARQLSRLKSIWGTLSGRRVHILGLGFRPEVKVDTFSPAYALRDELRRCDAHVSIEDPYYDESDIRQAGFLPGRAEDAEAVVLNTAHQAFANAPFTRWKEGGVVAVLDGRNLWQRRSVEAAGLRYFGIGRGATDAA